MAADPALVAAIAADPYAPAPRLAYADRLRARGEADRAQFVDVGLRLAALVAGADEPRGDTPVAVDAAWHARDLELDRLAARRDALLIAHGERWALAEVVRPLGLRVGGPAAWLTYDGITDRRRVTVPGPRTTLAVDFGRPLYRWGWDRGLVGAIALPVAEYVRLAPSLVRVLPGLTRVTLTDRIPNGYYPEADFHDTGPEARVYWAANTFERHPAYLATAILDRNPYVIPRDVYRFLCGGTPPAEPVDPALRPAHLIYPTAQAAYAALGRAAVDYARHLAGYPPLPETPR